MAENRLRILVVNPGSTSTKVALFQESQLVFAETLRHSETELAPFQHKPVLAQLDFRVSQVLSIVKKRKIDLHGLSAVIGRGGLLNPLPSGTYRVNDAMLTALRLAKRGEHAANLGALIAHELTQNTGRPAFIVDPVSVDEWPPVARLSGLEGLDRDCLSHALNTKAICKRYAQQVKIPYAGLRLIVAHLGSGFSISAHEHGRMVDVTNSMQEGAFSTERTGALPVMQLVDLCYSGKYSHEEMRLRIFHRGGLFSYLGSNDVTKIFTARSLQDEKVKLVFDAMIYQIGKELGAMSAVLCGRIDAILLTGGLAHNDELVAALKKRIDWIARVQVFAGEDELRALAEGGLRVLHHQEEECVYA